MNLVISRTGVIAAGTVVLLAALGGLGYLLRADVGAALLIGHAALPYLVTFLSLVVGGAVVFGLLGSLFTPHDRTDGAATGSIVGAIIGTVVWLAVFSWFIPYTKAKMYAAAVETTSADFTVDYRLPHQVALAQSRTALEGLPNADLIDATTRYSADTGESASFTTLVAGPAALGEYLAVAQQTYTEGGRTTSSQCNFSDAAKGKTLGGWFGHSLGRTIRNIDMLVNWTNDDAYGRCLNADRSGPGDVPYVIVPLTKRQGFFGTSVPYGAAIYNGHTGHTEIVTDSDEIPGGGYPISLAKTQREATNATDGVWKWMRDRTGWRAAPGSVAEAEVTVDGRGAYLTPLSYRGSTENVVGAAIMPTGGWDSGVRAPLQVHEFSPEWKSIPAIDREIVGAYQDIPNWQTIEVREVMPISDTEWVATIGNEQKVQYVVRGNGRLDDLTDIGVDSPTCLFQAPDFSNAIRCGTLALRGGNGIGIQYGQDGSGHAADDARDAGSDDAEVEVFDADTGSLAEMSTAELADLQRAIADEWSRRAGD